jgi:patatin-like phospholipase/acyl hydrolase
MSFKILCLDGGGIRGVISARILQEVEQQLQKPLNQYFDLIAGTSTGSILAAGLAMGRKSEELVNIYLEDGLKIFPYQSRYSYKRLPGLLKYKFSTLKDAVQGIYKDASTTKSLRISQLRQQQLLSLFKQTPKFFHDGLIEVLKTQIGDIKIKDIKDTKLLILAYDTFYRNTTFFTSHHEEAHRWYDDMELWKICVSSSSAPTFFPPYEFRWKDSETGDEWRFPHVDGGVSVNNPSLAALIHAIGAENQKLEDIAILSVGTGRTTAPFEYESVKNWGLIDWAEKIPDVFMGGQYQITVGLCQQVMLAGNPNSYLRLQFELNQRFGDRKTPTSPREVLPREQQVNKFTNKKVSEAIDDARPESVEQLIKTAEAFIEKDTEPDVNGNDIPVRQAIANFLEANH